MQPDHTPTSDSPERHRRLRIAAYAVLMAATAGITAARIANVEGVHGSNDRSRWLTVRALAENGEYTIGRREPTEDGGYRDTGLVAEEGWDTIDKVYHAGRRTFASDKTPALPTVVAPVYLAQLELGWDLSTHPREVVVTTLLVVSWVPLLVYLGLLAALVERLGGTAWGRVLVVACACVATFVPTFTTTLTNHTAAAFSCMYATYAFARIWFDGRTERRWFVLTGLFAGWTFCNALPACLFVFATALALGVRFPRRTVQWLGLGLAVPLVFYGVTNYLAYGYPHGWLSYPPLVEVPWSLQYEGSYWLEPESLDRGESSRLVYAFHYLLGHHGVLSLTPVFALSLAGTLTWDRDRSRRAVLQAVGIGAAILSVMPLLWVEGVGLGVPLVLLALCIAALVIPRRWWERPEQAPYVLSRTTLVASCFVIGLLLISMPNYGGHTAGPRHLLWLTAPWLLAMVGPADRIAGSRAWRTAAYAAIALSAFSAAYPGTNPWTHPWIYELFVR